MTKEKVKKKIFENLMTNIKNPKVIIFLIIAIALTIIPFSFKYGWDNGQLMSSAIVEISISWISVILFIIFLRINSVLSYLIFLLIFSFINTTLGLISYDAGEVIKKIMPNISSDNNATVIIKMVQLFIINGFAIANISMLIIMMLTWTLSWLDSIFIRRIKSHKMRVWYFVITILVSIIFISVVLNIIYNYEKQVFRKSFDQTLMALAGVKFTLTYGDTIFDIGGKVLFLMWLPVLLKINTIRKSQLFLNLSGVIAVASLINFIITIAYSTFTLYGVVLITMVFIMSMLSLWLLYYLYAFAKTIKLNYDIAKDEKYIPYIYAIYPTKNRLINWKEHSLQTKEMHE